MADAKPLTSSSGIDYTSIINPFMQELSALRRDIESIRTDMTLFKLRLAVGDEIDLEALAASDQSAKLLSAAIEGRASLTMKMASAISAIAGDISTETRAHLQQITEEFTEIRNDARRADALRRGVIPFAGGEGSHSVLSVLFGAHSIGQGIFSFMTMIESNNVRPVCRECRQAIKDFPWMDEKSKIKGSVKAWRAAFPVARAVNVAMRQDIFDADFVHIRGDARVRLHTVDMRGCKRVTNAAFVHLRGIQKLYMSGCNQVTITDVAFVNLRGIHTLDMIGCNQPTITIAALVHLVGIETLETEHCRHDIRIAAAQVLGIDYESESEPDSPMLPPF
jgi:hypothetical protein